MTKTIIMSSMLYVLTMTLGHGSVVAAPFCTHSQTTSPQCYYYDAKICRKDAAALGGGCVVNEEIINLPNGYGNYCLVTSIAVVECLYLDRASCEKEGDGQNGVCLRNYTKPDPLPSYEFESEGAYQSF